VLRYYAIATVIVLACLGIVTIVHRNRSDGSVRYATGSGTPGPAQHDVSSYTPQPVTGDAPWALSALPECFRQRASAHGTPAFARALIPRDARRIAASSRLRVADCTVDVFARSILVTRGENRLTIPPAAHLYVAGRALVLVRNAGGRTDVRLYALAGDELPVFSPAP